MTREHDEQIIDITRAREIIATCPCCGLVRRLPEGWQDMMRAAMGQEDACAWDGLLRCLNTEQCRDADGGAVMVTRLVVRD